MIEIIVAENPSTAWFQVCEKILRHGRRLNNLREILYVVVEIRHPERIDPRIDQAFRDMKARGNYWVDHTADYMCPRQLEFPIGDYTPETSTTRWSRTYWDRLTRYRDRVNQLQYIVDCLRRKPNSAQLFCAIFDAEIDIYPMIENPRRPYMPTMPCLAGLDFKCRDGVVHLFATFRSHDFGRKAYGNYIGLGRVLQAVCQDCGLEAGHVVCASHSAHIRRSELAEIVRICDSLRST